MWALGFIIHDSRSVAVTGVVELAKWLPDNRRQSPRLIVGCPTIPQGCPLGARCLPTTSFAGFYLLVPENSGRMYNELLGSLPLLESSSSA